MEFMRAMGLCAAAIVAGGTAWPAAAGAEATVWTYDVPDVCVRRDNR